MVKYLIKKLDKNRCYLLCMNHNSILHYLDDIEKEHLIKTNSGELIIDQLLVTGNGRNRFLACQFSYGKIEVGTAKNIEATKEFKYLSLGMFKQNLNLLKYSTLTSNQVDAIRRGHPI